MKALVHEFPISCSRAEWCLHFRSVKAVNNWKRRAIKQIILYYNYDFMCFLIMVIDFICTFARKAFAYLWACCHFNDFKMLQ